MTKIIALTITIFASQLHIASCFSIAPSTLRGPLLATSANVRTHDNDAHRHHHHRLQMTNGGNENTRRQALSKFLFTVSGISTSVVTFSSPAVAKEELFKPNVLTNGFLEKVCVCAYVHLVRYYYYYRLVQTDGTVMTLSCRMCSSWNGFYSVHNFR